MEPVFTIQYAEYAVADYLAKKLKTSVFIPSSAQEKGIDLLLYRHDAKDGNKVATVQVKMSRVYIDEKKQLPGYYNHLWFSRFAVQENADWFVLVGVYPEFSKTKGKATKPSKWETIMLAFTKSEMKQFMSEVKQKKNTEKDDRMFGFSFNGQKSIFQTRGFKTYRDMSGYLIEKRLGEITESIK